jgi:hypothetical protein
LEYETPTPVATDKYIASIIKKNTLPLKRYNFLQLANEIQIILFVASFSLTHKAESSSVLAYTFTFHQLLANFLTRISNKTLGHIAAMIG